MDSYGPAHYVPPPFNIPRSAPALSHTQMLRILPLQCRQHNCSSRQHNCGSRQHNCSSSYKNMKKHTRIYRRRTSRLKICLWLQKKRRSVIACFWNITLKSQNSPIRELADNFPDYFNMSQSESIQELN